MKTRIRIGKFVMPLVYFIAGIILVVGILFIAIRAGLTCFLWED
jgi:hypothetical protein